jgi:transposase
MPPRGSHSSRTITLPDTIAGIPNWSGAEELVAQALRESEPRPARANRPVRQRRTGVPRNAPAARRAAPLQLPDGPRQRLDSLLTLIGNFDRELTATTSEIDARAKTDERVRVLCRIRGVGRYTAMLVIAEVGDVARFPTARHLCAWAGLAPTVRSSDGKARLGHISRQGSPALRWALTEAAQKIPTGGGPLRAQFERIAKRRGRKIGSGLKQIQEPQMTASCSRAGQLPLGSPPQPS